MSGTRMLVRHQYDRILLDAIEHQRHLVLTHQRREGWTLLKAKFDFGSDPERGLITHIAQLEEQRDVPLPKAGDTLGCTFRVGHKKCLFTAMVDGIEELDGGSRVVLRWPDHVQQLQRRAYERVAPPHDMVIAVRFWRDNAGTGMRDVRHGQLENISAGGMRIKAPNTQAMVPGETCRCAFTPRPGRPAFVVDAVLRHREAIAHGRASLGLQFVGLESSDEGRRTLDRLARLVSHFQRAKQRRRTT